MANFGQLVLTNLGIREQYNAQAGKPLKLKRIGMGSGKYSGNVTALTRLVTENVSVAISKGYMQNGVYTIEGFFSNEALKTGFEWREIGVFVEDQNGNELLYCYANAGDYYDYIPSTEDERYSKYIRVATAISNAANVSIVENEGLLFVDTLTFQALKEDVDTLYPTKSKNGAGLMLDLCAEAPFVKMSVFGKSSQRTTTGAQLWENQEKTEYTQNGVTATFKDGVYTLNGTCTASVNFFAGTIALEAGNYCLSANNPRNNGVMQALIQVYSPTTLKSLACMDNANNVVAMQDLPEGSDYELRIRIENGVTYNNFAIKPMLNAGNAALAWEPFTGGTPSPSPEYPQDIVSAGDGGSVEIDVLGKNIFSTYLGTLSGVTLSRNSAGDFVLNGTCESSGNFVTKIDFPIPAGFYTLSANNPRNNGIDLNMIDVHHADKGETLAIRDIANYGVATAELSGGSGYVCRVRVQQGITYDNFVFRPQLEFNSIATEYENRTIQTAAVSTVDGLCGLPVQSGGNYTDKNGHSWICDDVNFEREVITKRLSIVDLATLEWSFVDTGEGSWWQAVIDDMKYVSSNTDVGIAIAEKYRIRTATGMSASKSGMFAIDTSNIKVNTGSAEESPTGLLLYKLKTPVEVPLSNEEIAAYKALLANNPTTTIFNDAGADMSVEYITATHESFFYKLTEEIPPLKGRVESIENDLGSLQKDVSEAESAIGDIETWVVAVEGAFVTPQMFGAKAQYGVDDTTAIQAAIDSGKPVRFPKGTYKTTAPLIFRDKHNYFFDAENAIIDYYGTDYAIYMRYVTNSTFRFGVVRAVGDGGGGGIHFYGGDDSSDFCQYVNIYFATIKALTRCVFAEQTEYAWINDIRFFNGRLMGGEYGFYLQQNPLGDGGVGSWHFDHIGFEGIATGVHFVTGGAEMRRFYFCGCRNEESFTTFISSDGAVNAIEYTGCSPLRESILDLASGSDGRVHTQIVSASGGLLGHSANIVNGKLVRPDSTRYKNFGNSHPDTFIDLRTFGALECPTFILSGGSAIDTLILPNYFGCIGGINKFFFRFAYATSGGTYKVKDHNESTLKEISVSNAFTNIRAEWYESTGWTFFKETGA